MADTPWKRDEPESPCVNICVVNPETRLCTGCKRSINEIAAWGMMSSEERRAVMDELPGRNAGSTRRRGGRRARLKRGS